MTSDSVEEMSAQDFDRTGLGCTLLVGKAARTAVLPPGLCTLDMLVGEHCTGWAAGIVAFGTVLGSWIGHTVALVLAGRVVPV